MIATCAVKNLLIHGKGCNLNSLERAHPSPLFSSNGSAIETHLILICTKVCPKVKVAKFKIYVHSLGFSACFVLWRAGLSS
jgi:hypothetical protein